jgi:uncharacterized protein YndB with AHSA1/START domain
MTDTDTALTIVRTIHAPRETVWSAWTSPERLTRWWWPQRFHTEYAVDLRVDGVYRFRTSEVPGIGVLNLTGRFEAVQPPALLTYTWRWESSDEHESRVAVDFLDRVGRTELRVHHEGLSTSEERENHVTGWNDCLDRLEVYAREIGPISPS